jgi:membrane protease YdiL (CAAX protease family)
VLLQLGVFYEELAFRGALQGQLHATLDWRLAVLISSVVFCVLHIVNVGFAHQWIVLLLLAVICGLIAARTACILPGLLIHAGYNFAISSTALCWGTVDLGALPRNPIVAAAVAAIGLMVVAGVLLSAMSRDFLSSSSSRAGSVGDPTTG